MGKRLRKKTTVPHYDACTSGGPHRAATVTDTGMKRSLDDPDTSSAKAHKQYHDASTTAGSASKSCATDVSQEPFEVRYWYLPDNDKLIWKFLDEFQRKPQRRGTSMEERSLANYIAKNFSKLHAETQAKLNDLDDPAGCEAFAKKHLKQLARQTCSPPDDLVRILQVIAQVPSQSVILKEKFEYSFAGSGKQMNCRQ